MLPIPSDTNTDYSGLKHSNINTFRYLYGKYISKAEAGP